YVPGAGARGQTMTAMIGRWREFPPARMVLPHPSWRTTAWERANPWFGEELLPELRRLVIAALTPPPRSAPCPRR
ncbi:MAG: hypothetical protein ACREFI_19795, partial [Stellaceae bacterium]